MLVTGSSGRVGSAVAAHLGKLGHKVTGFDLRPGPATTWLGSIDDPHGVARAMAGVDGLIHCAALHAPHVGVRPDQAFRAVNVDGTRCLLAAARATGVRRVVLTSSTSVYGHALVPIDRAAWVTEALVPRPRDIYDETKLAAEALCREADAAGLPCTVLRMARSFPEPLPELVIHRLHRGVDLRDVAAAHALALLSADAGFGPFNISAASPFIEADGAELLLDAASVIRRRVPDLAARFEARGWALPQRLDRVYVIEQAVARLGYRPRYGWQSLLD